MTWYLISEESLNRLEAWAKSNGILPSLKELNLQVAGYDGPPVITVMHPAMLPCNCLARERKDPTIMGFHSSECASNYEDTQEGIADYEDWIGCPYKREASQ